MDERECYEHDLVEADRTIVTPTERITISLVAGDAVITRESRTSSVVLDKPMVSSTGACLCTSFRWNTWNRLCLACGHDAHGSRIHCGVMVDA